MRVLVVHYSLDFTAYKAASGGVFLRCGTLSLGYNCTSWPCAKMVSTGATSSFEGGELGERGCKRVKIKTCVSKDSEFF